MLEKYPPIDPRFYEVDAASGMTDDEIEEDWHAFVEGLNTFYHELDKTQMSNPPTPDVPHKTLKDIAREIIEKFSLEEKHAHP